MSAVSFAEIAPSETGAIPMHFDAVVVPAGVEAAVVRRVCGTLRCIRVPAGAAAARALPQFAPGSAVLVLGLCGALDVKRSVGDVVVYDAVDRIVLDRDLGGAVQRAIGPTAVRVRATTVDHVVCSAAEKRRLCLSAHASVVDMESRVLAAALHEQGVRVAVVRVVSDDAYENLPDLGAAYDGDGRLRPLPVALAFLKAPLRGMRFVLGVRVALSALTRTAGALA